MIMIKVSYSFGIKMVLGATFKVSISPLFHSLFPPFSLLASWNSQLLLLGLSILNQPSPLHSWDNSIGLRYANLIPQMIMPWSQHWSSMTSEKHRPPSQKDWWWCVCVCVVCSGNNLLLWISEIFEDSWTAVIDFRPMRQWSGAKNW